MTLYKYQSAYVSVLCYFLILVALYIPLTGEPDGHYCVITERPYWKIMGSSQNPEQVVVGEIFTVTWVIEAIPGYYATGPDDNHLIENWGISGYGPMPPNGLVFKYNEDFIGKAGMANSFNLHATYYSDPCDKNRRKNGEGPPAMYHSIATKPRIPNNPKSPDGLPGAPPVTSPGSPPSGSQGALAGTPEGPPVDCGLGFVPEVCPAYTNPDVRTEERLTVAQQIEFISQNIEFNHSKQGFQSYIHDPAVGPRKYFLQERTITSLLGGNPESLVGGTIVRHVCPMSGSVITTEKTGNPSWYGATGNWQATETSRQGSFPVFSYDDCPNRIPDNEAEMTYVSNLTKEYTTDMMRKDTFLHAWRFKGSGYFNQTPVLAKLLIDKNQETISFQKTKYKVRVPLRLSRPQTVTWVEAFQKKDSNPDDEIDPEISYKVKQAVIHGQESQVFTINPEETPTKEGIWYTFLLPVEVAVDADRDGEITFDGKDKTTSEKPYRFWINDDVDKGNTVDGNDYEEDDLNESAKDSEDGKLNFRRDLEDLTRLWIDFSGINSVFPASDPSVALKVRIEADAGSPVINLYQPVETDGSREYLKDENTGYNQLQGIYGQQLCQVTSAATVVPRRAWETLPSDKVVHLLFEGATEGNGKLIFEIWKDGEKKCDLPSVHLNLKKAKDMYETWTVGDVDAAGVDFTKWPAASATQTSGQNIPAPEKPEEKDYIMFVHGWNMPPWEKETFASTMFKRMWHQGFKGRFGAFRWPTFYGLSGPSWGNLKGENIHTAHFDGSEQRAWNSASALKNLLIGRESVFGTNKIRLYAHSMGNIVSSEALRQMAPSSHVNTYISAQAAVPSHVWDKTTPQMTFNSPLGLNTPNVYGYYWQSTAYLPPHNWQNEGRPSYMDPQYMPSGTTYINHYNPLDWALSYDNWQLNQVLKPDVDYNYGWPALDLIDISLRFWKTQSIPPFRNLTFPNDRFEVFSYAAQSHGYATGQQGATGGKFNLAASVNLRGEYGFESAHKGHSAQFRSTIQKRWTYWRRALKDMNINLPTP